MYLLCFSKGAIKPYLMASLIENREASNMSSSRPIIDYSCSDHGDCAAKNVGNCCGFYPACVNADFCVDLDGVKAWCRETGGVGVCGYPVIAACVCESGKCATVETTEPATPLPDGATIVDNDNIPQSCAPGVEASPADPPGSSAPGRCGTGSFHVLATVACALMFANLGGRRGNRR